MLDEYKKIAIELGYELVFVSNDEYSILLKRIGEDIIFGVFLANVVKSSIRDDVNVMVDKRKY